MRAGNIQVGRIGGIPVEIHISLTLLIGAGAWQGAVQYGGTIGILYGILMVVFLYVFVLLHELAHGWATHSFGMSVRRIVLLPIGGLAQLDAPPSYPRQEFVIALAGPLINLALAILFGFFLFILAPFSFAFTSLREWVYLYIIQQFLAPSITGLLLYFVMANSMLFLFNIIPAFPMDGGRILRSGLAMMMDYLLATRLAVRMAQIMAGGMVILGLIGWPPAGIQANPLFLITAFMVFFGARHEEVQVRRRRALILMEVGNIYQANPATITPSETLQAALGQRMFYRNQILPVIVNGRVVGVLSYADLRREGQPVPEMTVAHRMRTEFPSLKLTDTLWVALQEMEQYKLSALPIVHLEEFQGIVTIDDINQAWRYAPNIR